MQYNYFSLKPLGISISFIGDHCRYALTFWYLRYLKTRIQDEKRGEIVTLALASIICGSRWFEIRSRDWRTFLHRQWSHADSYLHESTTQIWPNRHHHQCHNLPMPLLQGTAKSKISSVSIGVALTCCLCQRLFSNVLNKLVVGRKSCLSQETVIETRIVWGIWSRQSALNTDCSKTRRTRWSSVQRKYTPCARYRLLWWRWR